MYNLFNNKQFKFFIKKVYLFSSANVQIYLLEKSRIISQASGERFALNLY